MLTVLIISLIVAAVLFAAYYYFCAGKILSVNQAIKQVLNAEDVAAALKESKPLEPAWKAFENSLTRTNDVRYSTVDAAELFSVQTLTQGLNMTFWQSYGGIFTGLGILGTFAGLTYGLGKADMTSGDIEVLKGSIANLLSGVNTAFVTSLVGIFAGIVYSFAHHFLLKTLQGNIQRLTDKLDEIYPRRSVEDWLAEKFSEAKRQTRTLQSIDLESQNQTATLQNIDAQAQNQVATLQSIDTEAKEQTTALKNIGEAVSDAIHNALDEKLDGYVKVICAAIEHLGADGSDKLNEIFTKGVGAQMDRFSAALDKFSDSIDDQLKAANAISNAMNDQLLATLEELTNTLKRNEEISAAQRNADYEKFSSTLKGLTDTLNAVVEKFSAQQETAAGNFDALLKNSLDNFVAVMNKIFADAKAKSDDADKNFLATLESLTDTLNAVADNLKRQQEDAAAGFEKLLQVALDKFNTGMEHTMTGVQTKAAETNKQNRAASEQFLATLAALSKTLQDTADKINRQQETAAGNFDALLKNSLDNFVAVMNKIFADAKAKSDDADKNFEAALNLLIDELTNFTEQQKKILNENATGNAAQINEAVKAFREIVDRHNETTKKTFDRIQDLLGDMVSLLESMEQASLSFKDAANPVKQSTLQLTQNLTATSAQMKTLAEANQITRENLAALSTQLKDLVKNYNGIAGELERAITIVTDSLDNYNSVTNAGLKEKLAAFDKSMGDAVGYLQGAIEDFGDIVGYVKQNRGTVIK